jgi:hypothetical protein
MLELRENMVCPFNRDCLPHLSSKDENEAVRWVERIADQTSTYPYWNRQMRKVFFCIHDRPSGAAWMQTLGCPLNLPGVDEVVKQVYAAREPLERKEAKIAQAQQDEKSKMKDEFLREQEHDRAERLKDAKRLMNKVETKGISRPVVSVP